MFRTIAITKEEAEIFRAFIHEKIDIYSTRAEEEGENEAAYHIWHDAAVSLVKLDRSLGERLGGGQE